MNKHYDPSKYEEDLYNQWYNLSNIFHKSTDKFTIIMPPPNVTGQLHMGHALDNTLQDILVRYNHLLGKEINWIPGCDHAGIATQAKVEAKLKEEDTSKDELGRKKFLERTYQWKNQYHDKIVKQLKKLGIFCNWNRERFTLDKHYQQTVKEAFSELYHKGYIYQASKMVNYCPNCKTVLSDIEVNYESINGKLYYIKYRFKDKNEYLTVATTRPETLLGDTALVINPLDNRYNQHIGETLIVPIVNREIKLIADNSIDINFGTGIVKVTPTCDINDYELSLKHNLPLINVFDKDGFILIDPYKGLNYEECRSKIINNLGNQLEKTEDYQHNINCCSRCNTHIQPIISKQWFIKMDKLVKPAIDAVKNHEIEFIPNKFEKTYLHWLENIQDWCISRQLWWGHQIPAFHCNDCDNTIVSVDNLDHCLFCNSTNFKQNEDVLDTWFSSSLWPLEVTLNDYNKTWEEQKQDFQPTDILVTGYDIIFFWVARMIIMSLYFTGKVPFKKVLLHGLIRDKQNRKMSKSLGNGIDPLEKIEEYGTDALRFMLVRANHLGNDIKFDEQLLITSKNFCNKLYNASKLVYHKIINDTQNTFIDKWILDKLNNIQHKYHQYMNEYKFKETADLLYSFIWNDFCDWYLEFSKVKCNYITAQKCFDSILQMLHPFMPFITDYIWEMSHYTSIMDSNICNDNINTNLLINIISKIRNVKKELNISKCDVIINSSKDLSMFTDYINKLAKVNTLFNQNIKGYTTIIDNIKIIIPSANFDINARLMKLNKEYNKLNDIINKLINKYNNEQFQKNASAEVINDTKTKIELYNKQLLEIKGQINML